jgi:ABC-type phosphonate transport system ATPase subunit
MNTVMPRQSSVPKDGIRLSVTVSPQVYERLMAVKARTRRPTLALGAELLEIGLAAKERELGIADDPDAYRSGGLPADRLNDE